MAEFEQPEEELNVKAPLDINEIMKIVPHRYPFLFIDKVTELRKGHIVAEKYVTVDEPFFQGHFPAIPIMPGVLMIEAMAQAACVARLSENESKGKLGLFVGIENAKFRKQVLPGTKLTIECNEVRRKKYFGKCNGKITVDGESVCEATLSFMLVDKPDPVS